MLAAELVEVERCTWSAVLYPDGSLKRVNDCFLVIITKNKARLQVYKRDRIIGPAIKSSRVQELLQQLEKGISKEDLEK